MNARRRMLIYGDCQGIFQVTDSPTRHQNVPAKLLGLQEVRFVASEGKGDVIAVAVPSGERACLRWDSA